MTCNVIQFYYCFVVDILSTVKQKYFFALIPGSHLSWQHQSWTDDLPLCQMCGVGTAPNCVYGPDGKGTQSHNNEDGHLRFRLGTLERQNHLLRTEHEGSKRTWDQRKLRNNANRQIDIELLLASRPSSLYCFLVFNILQRSI